MLFTDSPRVWWPGPSAVCVDTAQPSRPGSKPTSCCDIHPGPGHSSPTPVASRGLRVLSWGCRFLCSHPLQPDREPQGTSSGLLGALRALGQSSVLCISFRQPPSLSSNARLPRGLSVLSLHSSLGSQLHPAVHWPPQTSVASQTSLLSPPLLLLWKLGQLTFSPPESAWSSCPSPTKKPDKIRSLPQPPHPWVWAWAPPAPSPHYSHRKGVYSAKTTPCWTLPADRLVTGTSVSRAVPRHPTDAVTLPSVSVSLCRSLSVSFSPAPSVSVPLWSLPDPPSSPRGWLSLLLSCEVRAVSALLKGTFPEQMNPSIHSAAFMASLPTTW